MRHLTGFEIYECRECRLFVNENVKESDVNNVNTSILVASPPSPLCDHSDAPSDQGRTAKLFTPRECDRSVIGSSRQGHKLGELCAKPSAIAQIVCKAEGGAMRGLHNSSFDPPTLVVLEAAFDEAWLTLKSIGNTTVKPDELARSVLRLAMEGERNPVRLHDGALDGLIPMTAWREAS
jgi:hypothetical protein